MADRVDTAVHGMQPPSPETTLDPSTAAAQVSELRPRHDTVLPFGDLRDGEIPTRGKKTIATLYFLPHVADRPPGAAPCPSSVTVFRPPRREGAANRG